jgi:hypothetical protein
LKWKDIKPSRPERSTHGAFPREGLLWREIFQALGRLSPSVGLSHLLTRNSAFLGNPEWFKALGVSFACVTTIS